MMTKRFTILSVLLALVMVAPSLQAASKSKDTASLHGKVVVKGRIEKVKLRIRHRFNPYGAVYNDAKPRIEIPQNLIVYLQGLHSGKPDGPAILSQKGRNFTSSIIPIIGGGDVEIRNDDTVRHHIRSNAKPWDFNLSPRAPGETVLRHFAPSEDGQLGIVPVYCDIHSDMRAHVLVMPNDKFELLPETGGAFTLAGLPPGTYTLTGWHPTLKPVPLQVTLKAGERKTVTLVMLGKQD